MKLSILYRGPLDSCNHDCDYCPFGKNPLDRANLQADFAALERFVGWVEGRVDDDLSVFFTPWGEALIHRAYQQALVRLSQVTRRVCIQTNLSSRLDWLSQANPASLALWCTYHPTQVSRERFVAAVHTVRAAGIRCSVGIVAQHAHVDELEALRREVPEDVYVWANAVKRLEYGPDVRARIEAVDPLFPWNLQAWPSAGRLCGAGDRVISVDGDGVVRRCHFVSTPLGNLYDGTALQALRPRPCPNTSCGCHIGYVHLDHLGLDEVYGEGLLERIPQ